MNPETKKIKKFIDDAQRVVVLQADNPDGDSLASALALEHILSDIGKDVYLYCGVDIPTYLRYLPGWDRVNNDLPSQFDLSIIVDTSSISLFEKLGTSGQQQWLASKPCIVIDHHATEPTITFAAVNYIKPAVATGELIYNLCKKLEWPLNLDAKQLVAVSILSDSLGLMSEGTTADAIHIIADLVESGVNLAELEDMRRTLMRKSIPILRYKGRLLERAEFFSGNRVAAITIPWDEIERYSPEYNPSMLVLDELRWVENVDVAIAFKLYRDGKITGKVRCNYGRAIAKDLAEHFGGGGHPYASGFKITDGRSLDEIRSECVAKATKLLEEL